MILLALAQQTSGTNGGGILASLLVTLIWMGVFIAFLVAWWRIFVKAGHPGWAALIPIYNIIVMLRIVRRPGWWLLLLFIPFINPIVFLILMYDLARAFGRGIGFTLGLICLNPIFILLLGFGPAQYLAAGEQPAAQPLDSTSAPGATLPQRNPGTPAIPQPRAAAAKPTNLGSPVEIAAAILAVLLLCGMLGMLMSLLGRSGNKPVAADTTIVGDEAAFAPAAAEEFTFTDSNEMPGTFSFGTPIDKGALERGKRTTASFAEIFETHDWTFTGRAGQMVTMHCDSAPDATTDPRIKLIGPDGQSLAEDDDSGGNYDALISDFRLPSDGIYIIRVDTWSPGAYLLTIE